MLRRRVLPALATVAILLVVEGLSLSTYRQISELERQKAAMAQVHDQALPGVLSKTDAALYREAFALQRAGRFEEADAAAFRTRDPLLRGVLLGERYLTPGNAPSFSEIALWLSRYGDHAQAGALYHLAQTRNIDTADFLTEPEVTLTIKGFSNGHDRSALIGEKRWVAGLAAYRRHDMPAAEAQFAALLSGEEEDLSADDRAAVAFWSYRAAFAAGDKAAAGRYLEMAAEQPPGFYSIIARQVSGTRAALSAEDAAVDSDITSFLQKKAVLRAIALKAVGEDQLAEKELRALFPGSSAENRKHLVQLARMLNLPAAQMRMAVAGDYDTSANAARYPVPHWTPTAGYRIEPALLFAIIRQESGFNPNARSASGAMGVMQLMPATAHAMARDAQVAMGETPAASMTLGQHYLEYLMDNAAISDNLIYVLGAYNAGPGAMAGWQKSIHAIDDPLLFVESIPSVQTRDYIVHVMGNYWVYAEMLGGYENGSVAALAQNHWPHYVRSGTQVVSMLGRLNADGGE